MSPADRPIVTVGALILDSQNRGLFVQTHKWSNLWGIPGGKIEMGETIEKALKREMLEETGLSIELQDFILVQEHLGGGDFYKPMHQVMLNYWAVLEEGCSPEKLQLNEEAQAYQWIQPKDALKLDLNQPTLHMVSEFIKSFKTLTN